MLLGLQVRATQKVSRDRAKRSHLLRDSLFFKTVNKQATTVP